MGAPGFDDAPMWTAIRADLPKHITFVYPYYENPKFLERQLAYWCELPDYIRQWMKIIIVDDCSPTHAAPVIAPFHGKIDIRSFRIEVDIRWNWLAARNIGMHHADTIWCALTDMDHMYPVETLDKLFYNGYDESFIYRFSRREHTGVKIHPHPNSMLMTREMFWRVGGYDEALSGHYGTDGDWRRRCAATAKVYTLKLELERHEYVEDSSTSLYQRKQPVDANKKRIVAKRKQVKNWKPKTLSFPYHEVSYG